MAEENATTTADATAQNTGTGTATSEEGQAASGETLDIGGSAASESSAASDSRPLGEPAKPDAGGFVWGTGRRKSAVARVRVRPFSDEREPQFLVNGRDVKDYFPQPQHLLACMKPLEATNTRSGLDVFVKAHGGGPTGQAEAVLLGVARALKGYDPATEQTLRDEGFLTRDPRQVERKKPGQPGARKRFQFSKR